jgi:hypothetical protein
MAPPSADAGGRRQADAAAGNPAPMAARKARKFRTLAKIKIPSISAARLIDFIDH